MEVSKIEMSVSCTHLPKMDRFSKSDPMCVLYQSYERGGRRYWEKEDHTEVIKDSSDPMFAKTFLVDYHFEEEQQFKLILYDIDDDYHLEELYKQDYMGEVEFCLAMLLTSGSSLTLPLRKEGITVPEAEVHVQAEDVQDSNYTIIMQLYCTNLDKKDLFGKSDPYLEICKQQENGSFTLAHRTSVIHKNLNPRWPIFEISIQKLCSGDWNRKLRFTCLDWNRSGDPQMIGEAYATLREICNEHDNVTQLPLVNHQVHFKGKKKSHQQEKLSGTLHFGSVRAIPLDSFLDYIRGGCEMTLMIAIDFTASNGAPNKPTSLHFNDRFLDNQYAVAIKSVASVLAAYDSNQKFPVFGFGAKAPDLGGVSHCFPLNGNPDNPEVDGVEGILDVYYYTLSKVELHGPTNFSMFLDKAIEMASKPVDQGNQRYYLLLVITDGVITDMQNTVDRIVAASEKPLSIIIVGVGNANFAAMETLDADSTPLVDRNGHPMKRDIVQFLQLQKHQSISSSFSLARETLAEIPSQFMSYMKMHNIKPNPLYSTRKTPEHSPIAGGHRQNFSPPSDGATAYNKSHHS